MSEIHFKNQEQNNQKTVCGHDIRDVRSTDDPLDVTCDECAEYICRVLYNKTGHRGEE